MEEDLKDLKILKQGAEARLYVCNYLGRPTLIKERFKKNYRHEELDNIITKDRIKNEARSIVRCKKIDVKTPALYLVDFVRRRIYMEHIEKSITVKDFIINYRDQIDDEKLNSICKLIAISVRKMHDNNIIHGDLTTSNMLLVNSNPKEGEAMLQTKLDIVMIDFGLSYIDSSGEDKGVDLYVLERAIASTHTDCPNLFKTILKTYKDYNKRHIGETLNKLEEVRARGRKRTMIG